MKDFYNPLLMLVIVVLLACRISGAGDSGNMELWALVLCSTGFLVDGALAVARALSRRPAVMPMVWSVVYLITGCCVWVMITTAQEAKADELAEFRAMYAEFRNGSDINARNASGETLLALAVECGRENVVRELVARQDVSRETLHDAALRAVECERPLELELLLNAGVEVNAPIGGSTLLCTAAAAGKHAVLPLLLERGADPNQTDAEGTPALIHGVVSGHTGVVRTLRAAGADPALTDSHGRTAVSFARSQKMEEALQ